MYFRYQAYNEDKELAGGWIIAASEAEALEELGEVFELIVQLTPLRLPLFIQNGTSLLIQPVRTFLVRLLGVPAGMNGHNLSINASEQFIEEDPPRSLTLRTDAGLVERRLIGHVEMYGGKEYLQLWTCLAVYIGSALLMWMLFPPLQGVELTDWLSEDRSSETEPYNTRLFLAVILVTGNSALSMLVLLYMLAMKYRLAPIGLAMVGVYALQWVGCVWTQAAEEGSGAAFGFIQAHPAYAILAWIVPVVLIVATERVLRQVLELTVPVYEDPETGKLEVGRGRN